MNDLVISLVRTWVPIAVGALVAWAASKGVDFSQETEVAMVAAATGAFSAIYYGVVRLLENKWPMFGVLLGSKKTPSYK